MTKHQIQSIGQFLSTYQTDLNYILQFQKYRQRTITHADYLLDIPGSFYSFLKEFKVIRNISNGNAGEVLRVTDHFVRSKGHYNVDKLAEKLKSKNLTHGKIATSLASKISFLANPWEIIPMDSQAKKALGQKISNTYKEFQPLLNKYIGSKKGEIDETVKFINPLALIIEKEFKKELKDLDIIRKNRITDKLLWVKGL